MNSKNKYFYFTFLFFICLAFAFSTQVVFAGVARLTWNSNNSSENVTGYKVHYGGSSGSYSTTANVGNVTTYTINNISDTGTTYFTVSAYNSAGDSSLSAEVKKTPGDIDKNGVVNIFDYNTLKTNFGSTGDNTADIDLNGVVNIFDYNTLKGNFGAQG